MEYEDDDEEYDHVSLLPSCKVVDPEGPKIAPENKKSEAIIRES